MPTDFVPDIAAPDFKSDPWPVLARLRHEAPVAPVRIRGRQRAWLVTRYADATAALKDPLLVKNKLSALGANGFPRWMPAFGRALARNMLDLDDPDHRRLRALVQPAFNARLIEQLRPRVTELSATLLDRIADRGTVNLIAAYAAPIPTTIIAEMLGIPPADRDRFRRWTRKIVTADTSEWAMIRALPPIWRFVRYLRGLIGRKRVDGGDDVIGQLIAAEEAGDRLDNDEVMAMAFLLLVAGHETTVSLIGNGMLALLDHPAALEQLRAEPSLIGPAIEEMLRFSGPLMTATERYPSEDVVLGGVHVPRGALVYVSLAAANRDETVFERPDSFEIRRQPNRHLAFGDGLHFCLGSALARMEGQVAMQNLVGRFGQVRLATERSRLRWKPGVVLRGVEALPVSLA